jgi:hypothetical protein
MPMLYIAVPDEERHALLDALRQLDLGDAKVVDATEDPTKIGLLISDMTDDPHQATERVGLILDEASRVAGRPFRAIATGETFWPETGEKL